MPSPPTEGDDRQRFKEASGRTLVATSIVFDGETYRQMERDGLVTRTVHPVIPPKVEYQLTALGHSLGEAFCGVWIWAEEHWDEIADARKAFAERGLEG